jgi:hypothetical protein
MPTVRMEYCPAPPDMPSAGNVRQPLLDIVAIEAPLRDAVASANEREWNPMIGNPPTTAPSAAPP